MGGAHEHARPWTVSKHSQARALRQGYRAIHLCTHATLCDLSGAARGDKRGPLLLRSKIHGFHPIAVEILDKSSIVHPYCPLPRTWLARAGPPVRVQVHAIPAQHLLSERAPQCHGPSLLAREAMRLVGSAKIPAIPSRIRPRSSVLSFAASREVRAPARRMPRLT